MEETFIGWDVGGAHLKAAQIEMDGRISGVWLEPCPLWRGLDYLYQAIDRIVTNILASEPHSLQHAITMTGEMADLFETRHAGVHALVTILCERLGSDRVLFYAGGQGWLNASLAYQRTEQVASANWHATAHLVSTCVSDAILIDIGSTTTDLIPIRDGRVASKSNSDSDRLSAGELVYTGVARTPVMAMANEAPVAGRFTPLMSEHFATSSDIYRVLGLLPVKADLHDSADGGAKTPEASRTRLARMVGRDARELPDKAWIELASWFADAQMTQIVRSLRQVLSREVLAPSAPLVIAGAGGFLGPRLAAWMERPVINFSQILGANNIQDLVDWCAPAVAVGLLLTAHGMHPTVRAPVDMLCG
ncbi:MAG: hydantoinase/oxoprolinase family protein [Thiobacillus sp.]|nr:hydantoinase/oxoprolinase family protein [Thiobacillus sp.]